MANPYKEIEDEEEDGEKPKKKGRRITDLKVSEISVVDKAANGERFLLYKAAGKPPFPPKKEEETSEEEDGTCPECGEDEADCECEAEKTIKKEDGNLETFVQKHAPNSSEESLEKEEFDEAGVLGLLNKHAK